MFTGLGYEKTEARIFVELGPNKDLNTVYVDIDVYLGCYGATTIAPVFKQGYDDYYLFSLSTPPTA